MKINVVWVTLPVLLLVTGCKEPQNSAANSPAVSEINTSPGEKTPALDRTPDSTAAKVDNSAKNVRDRNDATLTPGDQGGSTTDRDITQKVRRAVVSGPGDYSITAKNIKIITVDGKVTLRGPVQTEAEKTGIATLAKTIAGEANVVDELEVKANP